ncbi:hypothetical protein DPM19_18165 [Actinomadura craniellae]|uniref:Helix-turn-helix domain-containing protein n=1 Tax=Actinomadura craniellae TaxID=2231787 RepID=A0A365H3C1_9ACTN|nr:helix-turn-helix domain-containing protein [Actinomadura craniellae]RAY13604.1 hypothetical protein DPM19_18165 [Actinomadura craniellae]
MVVPAALVGPLLRVLVRALAREAREGGGGVIPPGIAEFLRALHEATDPPPVADGGNTEDPPDSIEGMAMVTVAQLAASSGFPSRTLRYWAAAGRVRAVRAGNTWLIDPESLKHRR